MDKEYIDREYYCNNICRCPGEECDKTKCPIWIAPAADVALVVKCKDCERGFRRNEASKLNFYWCDKWKNIVRDCDFCSYGERKNNGTAQT